MSFNRRLIDVEIELGLGNFGTDGTDKVKLTGLRVAASIDSTGGISQTLASVRIWGLTMDMINKLTRIVVPPSAFRLNKITIYAGDSVDGMSAVFMGFINSAYGDFENLPEVVFVIFASSIAYDEMQKITPTSYKGSENAVTILSGICVKIGRSLINNGVEPIYIRDYALTGTGMQQIKSLAQAANFAWTAEGTNSIVIWPKNGHRGGKIPIISSETGMVSCPKYNRFNLIVKTLFNPALSFGSRVEIRSDFIPINRNWVIIKLSADLASKLPGGPWFSTIEVNDPSYIGEPQ